MEIDVYGRVVVGVSSTLAGLHALRFAIDQARQNGTTLLAVRAYRASGTGNSLRPIARQAAIADVYAAFNEANGGTPDDVTTVIVAREGTPSNVLVAEASREDDLLVLGGSGARRFGSLQRAACSQRCARLTVCPMVIVPLPAYVRTRSTGRLARALAAEVGRFLVPIDRHPPADPS